MASDEDTLTAVLDRDQRSFRRVLIAGIALIVVVILLGALLAAQTFQSQQRLAADLAAANANIEKVERSARLEAHRLRQQANNAAIADSRRNMESRAAFEDMRNLIDASSPGAGAFGANPAGALDAASAYLAGRRLPLVEERAILSALSASGGLDDPSRNLLSAVDRMRRFDKAGGQLRASADGSTALSPELTEAAALLDSVAAASPALKQAAVLGRARIDYILASSNNFSRPLCDAMFKTTAGIARNAWSIQLLLNRAECWRKNGDSARANEEFNTAVRRLAATPPSAEKALSGTDADPLVQYQAYHGRGTTLIAIADENDQAKLKVAQEDLKKAVELRKLGGQIEIETMGSLENLGLAYLKAGQYQEAANNAKGVSRVVSYGWNEIVRAISADRLKDAATATDARQSLENFRRTEFNECELIKLVGPRNRDALLALLVNTRDRLPPAVCAPATTVEKKT